MKKWLYKKAFRFIISKHIDWVIGKKDGIRLSFENVPKVLFHRTQMADCEFHHANLVRGVFMHSRLAGATFKGSEMSNTQFEDAMMFTADFANANVRKAHLNIHVRNRQKEDLIALFTAIDKLESDAGLLLLKNLMGKLMIADPRGKRI